MGKAKDNEKVDVGSGLACVEYFDPDLVCARGFHLDLLDLEGLALTPAHGGLALDHLSRRFGHEILISLGRLCSISVGGLTVQYLRKAGPAHIPKPCAATPSSFSFWVERG